MQIRYSYESQKLGFCGFESRLGHQNYYCCVEKWLSREFHMLKVVSSILTVQQPNTSYG